MSGVAGNAAENVDADWSTVTPGSTRAFLVEAFNRILITRLHFTKRPGQQPFKRGITVFEEKDDLLPFEEAKLYGHNATHALAAYLAALRNLGYIADLTTQPGLMPFLRDAFIAESGAALMRRWRGRDALVHAHRLCCLRRRPAAAHGQSVPARQRRARRPRPTAQAGLGRPPDRHDARRYRAGRRPAPLRVGAAAALVMLHPELLSNAAPDIAALLAPLWGAAADGAEERGAVLELIGAGLRTLQAWQAQGYPDLQAFIG